ncbi:phosphotransferase [Halomicrobium sp. IBSBa]|uniref:phosphotransferase family protein n=1 Tax=Halomicrobium sp. IBSBa TaxID=2778916 RepID=UPI001ABF8FF4|nr:phosphotransferase [Halomicrobium sp. IBSBa]MBO4246813.1 phosphotransferase [Halomicrobium sp. IBSBa]
MTRIAPDVTVQRILDRVLQTRAPAGAETPPQGNHKDTTIVRYPDRPDVVVQLTATPSGAHTEATLLAAVYDQTTVPVARLLGRGRIGDRGYLVTEHVSGRDLHESFVACSRATRERIARRFGRCLGELHDAFAFDAAGPVEVGASGTLAATGPDGATFFEEYASDAVEALPSAFDDRRPAIEAAVASRPERAVQPRLFPWDLRPGNAILADGDLAAVLDWADPLAADPALAVAKVEHLVAAWYVDDPTPLRSAFREGYAAVRPLPDVSVADRVAAIAASAVDSNGTVTRPRYPELTGTAAVAVHREWFDEWLDE